MRTLRILTSVLFMVLACGCVKINGNTTDDDPVPDINDDPSKDGVDPSTLPAEDWFTVNYLNRTDVQRAGFRGPVKSVRMDLCYVNGGPRYNYHTVNEYNEAGMLVRMRYINSDDDSYNKTVTFAYDSKGRRSVMNFYYGEEERPSKVYNFVYNNPGKRVAFSWYDWAGESYRDTDIDISLDVLWLDLSSYHAEIDEGDSHRVEDRTYTFDDDGNLTIHDREVYWNDWDSEGTVTTRKNDYLIVYSNGYPYSCENYIESASWHMNGMPAKIHKVGGYISTWYENYNWVCKKSYIGGPEGMLSPYWEEYTYDDNWDLVEREACFSDLDYIHHFTWTDYAYDKHGNWVRRNYTCEPILQPGTFSTDMERRTIDYWGE